MVRETAIQARRRKRATGISKKWNIARRSQRPRGLSNSENDCYRNGAIQPLINFPRFVNWILDHNTEKVNWPCGDKNPDGSLAGVRDDMARQILSDETYKKMSAQERQEYRKKPNGGTIRGADLQGHKVENYSGCLACLLKALILDYWGKEMLGSNAPHHPMPFPYNRPSVYLLHQLFQRYFCEDADGHSDDVDDWRSEYPPVTEAEIDRRTRVARRNYMTAQQDADELFSRITDGIEATIDKGSPDGLVLEEQFASLFKVHKSIRRTCISCGNIENAGFEDSFGFRIVPGQTGNGTVASGIARTLHDTVDYGRQCEKCDANLVVERTWHIDSTPEYLRVHMDLSQVGPDNVRQKIANHIAIEETLHLTGHMTNKEDRDVAPVQYRLHSVTYHAGTEMRAGHYVAGVTGPGARHPAFFINDGAVEPLKKSPVRCNPLTANPLKKHVHFDAATLWYERMHQRRNTDMLAMEEGTAFGEAWNKRMRVRQGAGVQGGTASTGGKQGAKKPYVTQRGRLTYT